MSKKVSPIFHDPKLSRWSVFKKVALVVTLFLITIYGFLVTSVLVDSNSPSNPESPRRVYLSSPQSKPPIDTQKEKVLQQNLLNLKSNWDGLFNPQPNRPKSETIGIYVNWDENSFTSLKQNIQKIDQLIPEWLHVTSENGEIELDNPTKQRSVLNFVREQRPNLPITPLVNNFDSSSQDWESENLVAMLKNQESRKRSIESLLKFVLDNNLNGLSVDFEGVPPENLGDLKVFMRELSTKFKSSNLQVSQFVPFDDQSFPYPDFALLSDYLILMAYDQRSAGNGPGAVASQAWFEEIISRRFKEIPKEKVVLALGNYGYDWKEGTTGTGLTFREAVKTAQESGERITLDPETLNPTFNYSDEKGFSHQVWFLDGVTAFNQISRSRHFGLRGFAFWRLGSEDPSLWAMLEKRETLTKEEIASLKTIHYDEHVVYQGRGEILKVTAVQRDGAREVNFDEKLGLITQENFTSFPSPYLVSRWGGKNKNKIALTFDDGPNALYTPKILDLLNQQEVKATFFVTGLASSDQRDLLNRILKEGHEIGNHTFFHPDVTQVSPQRLGWEITLTRRFFESQLGRNSILFRPPFGEDIQPEKFADLAVLTESGRLGYYTVGMNIDSLDWKKPGAAKIVEDTINKAVAGEGNIILFHDGGGDRSQTVEALPEIIEELKEKGFELVTVSDLLGIKQASVMPPIVSSNKLFMIPNWLGFFFMEKLKSALSLLFLLAIFLGIIKLTFTGFLAIDQKLRNRWNRQNYDQNYQPFVSVIVPAFNEEKVIVTTLNAILLSNYPNFEVIFVDDGSTDNTIERVKEAFGQDDQVKILAKGNGGKAKALNYGLDQSEAEVIVALDADTILKPEAIGKLVRHFANPKIVAVAGNAKVGNRINILTYWQALEYIVSQNLDRRAFDTLNCITVVPGSIGAWRRKSVYQVGGYTSDTLAEDADLTFRLIRRGYKIVYEDEAIALTEAPDNVRGFLKQRFRWMFGMMQVSFKHLPLFFQPNLKTLGKVAIPNILIFQIFFPLISPIIDLFFVQSLITIFQQIIQNPGEIFSYSSQQFLVYYLIFLLVDFSVCLIGFSLERREDWKLLLWFFFQRFFYRQLMYYVAIKSVLSAIKGRLVGWGKLERKATVSVSLPNPRVR